MIRVIRTENGVSKTVDIQKSIWRDIVNGAKLPDGVTYAPAPAPKTLELILEKPKAEEIKSEEVVSVAEDFKAPETIIKKGKARGKW